MLVFDELDFQWRAIRKTPISVLELTHTGQYKTFLLENRVSVLKVELTKLTTGSSKSNLEYTNQNASDALP